MRCAENPKQLKEAQRIHNIIHELILWESPEISKNVEENLEPELEMLNMVIIKQPNYDSFCVFKDFYVRLGENQNCYFLHTRVHVF